MTNFIQRLLSIGADKRLNEYRRIVSSINLREPHYQALSDEELAATTDLLKDRLANGETLDDILVDAFAAVREVSVRTLGMRHYDEQLIASLALHNHMIAEAATGSGKTLACTPAVYLNALEGKGVHVVTVNDYLAERDATQMSNIYNFLGLSCKCLKNDLTDGFARQGAYDADITYGTNSEFGFDYLRDNMTVNPNHKVQRGHHFAIVDEVDSILIDEARTPLIISGAGKGDTEIYKTFARAATSLIPEVDFEMDEAKKTIATTEAGLVKVEKLTGIDIYADTSGAMVNHLQNALKAQFLFHRDQEYMVNDGEVLIVDEFTGRVLPGRRYSDGLHQAIEAKEHVEIKSENETLATVTLQNYFRMYDKLAGMTGTAMTEDAEFRSTYNLPVMAIPDHKPNIRVDHDDVVYISLDAKFNAIADEVTRRHAKGQPCLIGTVSIENSERISRLLAKRGLPHNVLNAKHHAREAEIVAQAGRFGAITIATNMAGRGTDILLGGNPDMLLTTTLAESGYSEENPAPQEVIDSMRKNLKEVCAEENERVLKTGGLCILGSERHESRRIDNQLRGRAGRQGDPGETRFYLSLEDDLLRKYAGERLDSVKASMASLPPDEPLHARILTKLIESSQHRIEEVNYAQRKHTLEYDDVMNKQRQTIYEERDRILYGEDIIAEAPQIAEEVITRYVTQWMPQEKEATADDVKSILTWASSLTGASSIVVDKLPSSDELINMLCLLTENVLDMRLEEIGDNANNVARQVMLKIIDTRWRTYIQEMDYLKNGIGLRGFGQRDPLVEYKREAYEGFGSLVATIYEDWLRIMCHIEMS